MFANHCARCHQAGELERPLPSGHLANILALDDLAKDSVLLRPGLPDASRLYDVLATRHAPLDVYGEGPDVAEPSPEEIGYVRDWIRELPRAVQSCPDRKRITAIQADALMQEAQLAERDQSGEVRFISLMHLHNTCVSAAEIAAYRQALTILINGLSWAGDPVKLTALDPEATLFSFKLSDIGWRAQQWQMLADAYPQSLKRSTPDDILATAGTPVPLVNGDWLAGAALAPPLYNQLLGLPAKLSELARMNGVDIDANIRRSAARRAVVRSSKVTRANRLIERHPGQRGGFWLAYDFSTSAGTQDLFTYPLGPKSAVGARSAFTPDEIRVVFALPNGFWAFALYDAQGNRIDRVLPGIEQPFAGLEAASPEPTTEASHSCIRCHADGIISAKDDFLPFVGTLTGETPSDARAGALPMFGNEAENALLIGADVDRYRAALRAVGIDKQMLVRGDSALTELARRHLEDTDLNTAIAETGVDRAVFTAELESSGGAAAPLARRLVHGALPREDLDRLFTLLKGIDAPSASNRQGGFLGLAKTEIGLSLWIDKARPKAGDLVTLHAETDSVCYLTVIGIDAQGKATVLFPNEYVSDNRIAPGEQVSIPSSESPFQLRYKGDGIETIIGRCSASAQPPAGIEHDFVRQRFTALGDWEAFIEDTLVTEAELRRDPRKAERARIAQEGARRQRQARGEPVDQRRDIAASKNLRDGRAVLVLGDI